MTVRFPAALLITFCLGTAASAADASVQFSHKTHRSLRLPCAYCHPRAQMGERAGFPAASTCRGCHTEAASKSLKAVLALSKDTRIRPAKPVYTVKDFVFFRHDKHANARLSCDLCHGEVYDQDTVTLARPTTMKACVACHKEHQATLACNACHELGH